MDESSAKLVNKLNYQFNNPALLELALTHRSASSSNNERLEYLGDAVLGFVIADLLYQKFNDAPEGVLTRLRASLVKKESLASLAKKMDLGDFLKLGPGEMKSGGWRRDSILSNTLEAVIGAIYLDSDFDKCRIFIQKVYAEVVDELSLNDTAKDSKTELQEYLQARKLTVPLYHVIAEEGEAHKKTFTVECQIDGLTESISAQGGSKRIAAQSAAHKVLVYLQSNE